MITLKCKMCGGALQTDENATVAECEYCGTRQTLPKLDDEKKTALFERANLYRSRNEFDKAAVIYENIINDAPDEAEAYWGLCLCRYGIEYVVDPRSQKRIPTCHRTQFKSILEDSEYLSALEYAGVLAKDVYREEAQYIDKVQKNILAISSKEDPFDIFICYKETDENGDRTKDSVIAQDIYTELTDKGYKVFFSRITLEDKLGTAYEPYIFAALNSAKIMLVVASNPEYYEAVWVRNEWNRYLALIEQGQKKTIIPCYRDMTVNDMPQEFAALQALDVSKIGYMQDLLRGIGKILAPEKKTAVSTAKTKPTGKVYDIISHVQSIGGNNPEVLWPKGPISSTLNKDKHSTVSFQVYLRRPIENSGTIVLNFTVYDGMNNVVCQDSSHISVNPGNNKIAKLWILKGADGTSVEDGNYKAVFKINNSLPVEYKFKVTSGGSVDFGYAEPPAQPSYNSNVTRYKSEKSLAVYLVLCLFLGSFGIHSFYAGRKGKGVLQLILSFTGIGAFWALIDLVKAIIQKRVPEEI